MTSKEALLVAAERLMAERGVDVPLRDIAAAAGQRNNSAVHYHFGSREALVLAVLELRSVPQHAWILEELARLEADGQESDVYSLVDLLVRPLCVVPYAHGARHYARFLAQVYNHPALADLAFDTERWPAARIVVERIYRLLTDQPPAVRRRRLATIHPLAITFLADHERRADPAADPTPERELVDDLVASTVGMLTAKIRARV
jgi:AcrR family transcriptional regulator